MAAQQRLPRAAGLSDETLAWQVRAALRAPGDPARWPLGAAGGGGDVAGGAEGPGLGVLARAPPPRGPAVSAAGLDAAQASQAARQQLESIASPLTFYGQLAVEDLGMRLALPASPAAPTDAERQAAAANPGLQRALRMIAIGLRPEGVREWNFTLRGMDDRALLAAARAGLRPRGAGTAASTRATARAARCSSRSATPRPSARTCCARPRPSAWTRPTSTASSARSRASSSTRARTWAPPGSCELMPATARWTAKKVGVGLEARARSPTAT
jgi:soluble lytic murein transglycosylase